EYLENVKTKGFWIGVLLVPIVFFGIFHLSSRLTSTTPTRYYVLVDQSGQYAEQVELAIRREHQRRVMQEFMRYLQANRIDANAPLVSREPSAQLNQLIDDFGNDEISALNDWLSNGGLTFALTMAKPYLRPDAPAFEEPRQQFIPAPLPPGINPDEDPQTIVDKLRPYLTGERYLQVGGEQISLFALILIPQDVEEDIVRPATLERVIVGRKGPFGVQYWANNLTDTRLPNAIQSSINNSIRQRE